MKHYSDMGIFQRLKAAVNEGLARRARHQIRSDRREVRHAGYATVGLNGKRAVARRLRQIESGRLTVANGLCPEVRS